jgi:S1-C subfamily serine protease
MAKAGIVDGYIITEINGKPVNSQKDVENILNKFKELPRSNIWMTTEEGIREALNALIKELNFTSYQKPAASNEAAEFFSLIFRNILFN